MPNAAATTARPAAAASPGSALRDLIAEARRYVHAKASRTIEDWTHKLDGVTPPDGAAARAGYEGVKAVVTADNPVWAAAKGAWLGASGGAKAAVVVSLVVMLLLAPVLLVVLLLGLLTVGIVAGVRAAAQ